VPDDQQLPWTHGSDRNRRPAERRAEPLGSGRRSGRYGTGAKSSPVSATATTDQAAPSSLDSS
jgi:hypothetical protein